eukprot:12431523-Karenia_brevis.AAC.1
MVTLDFAAGGIATVKNKFKATVSQYTAGNSGRLQLIKGQTLLRNCFDHCLRNCFESGQKDGGWSKIKSLDKPGCVKALKSYVAFAKENFPIVVFDFFWYYKGDEISNRPLKYEDGSVREAQPAWWKYFKDNKLQEIAVPLPEGGTMMLFNATWRGGPDFAGMAGPSTNPEEAENRVLKKDFEREHEELISRGMSSHKDPNLLELFPKLEEVNKAYRARRWEKAVHAFPTTVDPNRRDGCKTFTDPRCKEYSAKDYVVARENSVNNFVTVSHKGYDFYVYATVPHEAVCQQAAEDFVELLCLPPALDRHQGYLESKGYLHDGHLSWRALTAPFCTMKVVEVVRADAPYREKVCCLTCCTCGMNYQCGCAILTRFKEGDETADPRPSALTHVPRPGPGRPPVRPKRSARTSQAMLEKAGREQQASAERRQAERAATKATVTKELGPRAHSASDDSDDSDDSDARLSSHPCLLDHIGDEPAELASSVHQCVSVPEPQRPSSLPAPGADLDTAAESVPVAAADAASVAGPRQRSGYRVITDLSGERTMKIASSYGQGPRETPLHRSTAAQPSLMVGQA